MDGVGAWGAEGSEALRRDAAMPSPGGEADQLSYRGHPVLSPRPSDEVSGIQGWSPALSSLPKSEAGFASVGAGSPGSPGRQEPGAARAARVSPEPTCSVASVPGGHLLLKWGQFLEGHSELPGLGLAFSMDVNMCRGLPSVHLCCHLTCQRN